MALNLPRPSRCGSPGKAPKPGAFMSLAGRCPGAWGCGPSGALPASQLGAFTDEGGCGVDELAAESPDPGTSPVLGISGHWRPCPGAGAPFSLAVSLVLCPELQPSLEWGLLLLRGQMLSCCCDHAVGGTFTPRFVPLNYLFLAVSANPLTSRQGPPPAAPASFSSQPGGFCQLQHTESARLNRASGNGLCRRWVRARGRAGRGPGTCAWRARPVGPGTGDTGSSALGTAREAGLSPVSP